MPSNVPGVLSDRTTGLHDNKMRIWSSANDKGGERGAHWSVIWFSHWKRWQALASILFFFHSSSAALPLCRRGTRIRWVTLGGIWRTPGNGMVWAPVVWLAKAGPNWSCSPRTGIGRLCQVSLKFSLASKFILRFHLPPNSQALFPKCLVSTYCSLDLQNYSLVAIFWIPHCPMYYNGCSMIFWGGSVIYHFKRVENTLPISKW